MTNQDKIRQSLETAVDGLTVRELQLHWPGMSRMSIDSAVAGLVAKGAAEKHGTRNVQHLKSTEGREGTACQKVYRMKRTVTQGRVANSIFQLASFYAGN